MTPFRAPRKTGDKTQDTNRTARARKQKQARQQPVPESEEATANGLVWPEPEEQVLAEESSNPWWPDLPSTEIVNSEVQCPGKSMGDEESPRLTDYESEGYIARRKARIKVSEGHQRRKFSEGFMLLTAARDKQIKDLAVARAKADLLAKDKIVRKAQAELAKDKRAVNKRQLNKNHSSDDDEDNVPFSTLISKETRSNTQVVVVSDKDVINRTKGWLYRLLVKEGIILTYSHNNLLLYDGFLLLVKAC